MKPILIHIHLYYCDMWPEMKALLENIRSLKLRTSLVVTLPDSDCMLTREIGEQYTDARILRVPNQGYDIAPFLEVLRSVNLEDYSYVIKLHTKRDMPGDVYLKPMPYNYGGSRWRDYLLNFCRCEHLPHIMQRLAQEADLGMVADYRLIRRAREARFVAALDDLLNRAGLQNKGYQYVMGSMFICRACLLAPLKALGFRTNDFPVANESHSENLAHEMERFLGLSVLAQGYRIADPFTPRWKQSKLIRVLKQIALFLYFRKRGGDGSCIIKICKIPVYRKRGAKLT